VEEEYLTDAMAEEAAVEQLPLKITDISWRHTDEILRKEIPDTAHVGDKSSFRRD